MKHEDIRTTIQLLKHLEPIFPGRHHYKTLPLKSTQLFILKVQLGDNQFDLNFVSIHKDTYDTYEQRPDEPMRKILTEIWPPLYAVVVTFN